MTLNDLMQCHRSEAIVIKITGSYDFYDDRIRAEFKLMSGFNAAASLVDERFRLSWKIAEAYGEIDAGVRKRNS